VVGVVADARHPGFATGEIAEFDAYVPLFQFPPRSPAVMAVLARVRDLDAVVQPLREAVQAAAPGLAVYDVQSVPQRLGRQTTRQRLLVLLMAAFAALAVTLAATGIYAVVSYAVTRRTREIGIRVALGAARGHVIWQVVRRGVGAALVGVAIGFAVVSILERFLVPFLHGVSPTDPSTLSLAALVLALVVAAACVVPAWRATRVDATIAMRAE
jgi:ABC-type lipoprotein release transport system permease subunit